MHLAHLQARQFRLCGSFSAGPTVRFGGRLMFLCFRLAVRSASTIGMRGERGALAGVSYASWGGASRRACRS